VLDEAGNPLVVGSRVQADPRQSLGTVIRVTDPDGDVDEYGRQIGINPQVYVQFDDSTPGEQDCYGTFWTATGPSDDYAPYRSDDLLVVG
jgi:hypothetical protein